MDEAPMCNLDLSRQTLLRLNKINEIKDYFITEVSEIRANVNRIYNQSRRIHCNHQCRRKLQKVERIN